MADTRRSSWRRVAAVLISPWAIAVVSVNLGAGHDSLPGQRAGAAPVPRSPVPEKLVVWSVPLNVGENPLEEGTGIWTPDGKHVLAAGRTSTAEKPGLVGEVWAWDSTSGN